MTRLSGCTSNVRNLTQILLYEAQIMTLLSGCILYVRNLTQILTFEA